MPTECSATLFEFAPVEGRQVVAAFDGGAITSDAGALLLGETDRAIRLTERFAACFTDARMPELVEHEVETLVLQRVVGIALGYEDLNDHDELRHDPVLAVLAGKLAAKRVGLCAAGGQVDAEPAGAEPRRADALSQGEPRPGGDRDAVRRSVPGGASAPAGADHSRSRCHRRSAARPSGRPVLPRLLRLLLLPAALRVLRPASAGGQAAALQHRCLGRSGRGDRADRGADPPPLAEDAHPAARRFRLCPRGADGLVRGQPRRLPVRPGAQRAAGGGDQA